LETEEEKITVQCRELSCTTLPFQKSQDLATNNP